MLNLKLSQTVRQLRTGATPHTRQQSARSGRPRTTVYNLAQSFVA